MPEKRRCSSCGAAGVGKDGLCKACRIERDEGPEAKREYMAKIGRRGAYSLHSQKAKGLDEKELPPLESHEDAKQRLDLISRAVLTGRIGDRPAQAAIRGVEAWLKAEGERLAAQVVEELKVEVDRIKAELTGRPKLRATP